MYFTGGTIIFDHGHGISTLYMHMKDIDVKVGQKIKARRNCWNTWTKW